MCVIYLSSFSFWIYKISGIKAKCILYILFIKAKRLFQLIEIILVQWYVINMADLLRQLGISLWYMYDREKQKKRKKHDYKNKSRMRANWFYQLDTKEINVIVVNVIYKYTLQAHCNLYTTTLFEETVSYRSRVLCVLNL